MARSKRRYTQELLKAQEQGYNVVIAFNIHEPSTRTHQVHVRYAPRHKTDAHPWIEVWNGKETEHGIRYSGRECTIENRYVVEKTSDGHAVLDVATGVHATRFCGVQTYQKADSYAWEANRRHIRKAMFGIEITEPIG